MIKIDLKNKRVELLLSKEEIKERFDKVKFNFPGNQAPWQELSRKYTGQLQDGACLDLEEKYFNIAENKGIPRDNH